MLWPQLIYLIKQRFQTRVDTPDLIYNLCSPVEVFLFPFQRPVGGWVSAHVPEVTDLIRQFDEFCGYAAMGRIFDLQALALRLGKLLVVGNLHYDVRDLEPEQLLQFPWARLCIFHGIVQDGCRQDLGISDITLIDQQFREFYRVIDIGGRIRIQAALIAMLLGSEVQSIENQGQVICHSLLVIGYWLLVTGYW